MQLTDFRVLTFDCYGTLIDWETGILEALAPLLDRANLSLPHDDILAIFARHEAAQQQATPAMRYSELLASVHRELADEWQVPASDDDHARFGASIAHWPAFPDSAPALLYLKHHYRLVVLSNIDRASFAASNQKLGEPFDAVYTAEAIGSYKPDPNNFHYLIKRLAACGYPQSQILHTAQSLFHDHVPAKTLGLATAWIDRRHGRPGWGATMPPQQTPVPDFHFPSLAAMADAHQKSRGHRRYA